MWSNWMSMNPLIVFQYTTKVFPCFGRLITAKGNTTNTLYSVRDMTVSSPYRIANHNTHIHYQQHYKTCKMCQKIIPPHSACSYLTCLVIYLVLFLALSHKQNSSCTWRLCILCIVLSITAALCCHYKTACLSVCIMYMVLRWSVFDHGFQFIVIPCALALNMLCSQLHPALDSYI